MHCTEKTAVLTLHSKVIIIIHLYLLDVSGYSKVTTPITVLTKLSVARDMTVQYHDFQCRVSAILLFRSSYSAMVLWHIVQSLVCFVLHKFGKETY